MNTQNYPLNSLNSFSSLLFDYLKDDSSLRKFYENAPRLSEFEKQIKLKKSFHLSNRKKLIQVLTDQYQHLDAVPTFELLNDERTFTVTTGHQLNLFTGPLYVIYKIITTINLARKLKSTYPTYHFIPVYWMASEDHDFEEINHFNFLDRTFTWLNNQKGAVGRFDLTEMIPFFKDLPATHSIFTEAYTTSQKLSDAVRKYMHALFGAHGLVCLDADDAALKSIFTPVLQTDLFENAHLSLVEEKNQALLNLGYKPQINAREINLFYLTSGGRDRIEKEGDRFNVLNQPISFSKAEMEMEIQSFPERFSPNVVLRPLYQEMILPNLAYVGGPAEVTYWLQLKGIFDQHNIPFPIILPRNFGLLIKPKQRERMNKLGVDPFDLFQNDLDLKRNFVDKNSPHDLSLSREINALQPIVKDLISKVHAIDVTLEQSVLAQQKKWNNELEKLEKKIRKAEEKNQEIRVRQLQTLKNQLFPSGQWQERHDNFLTFYLSNPTLIRTLLKTFNPLLFEMYVINLT